MTPNGRVENRAAAPSGLSGAPWCPLGAFRLAQAPQLLKNVVSGTLSSIINAITMAVTLPFYLRYLGYETYGLWLVLSTLITLVQLCNFGFGPAVTKLVAEQKVYGRTSEIPAYTGTALITVAAASGAAALILTLNRYQVVHLLGLHGHSAEMAMAFLPWVSLLSVYVLLIDILSSTLSGLGRIDLANYTVAAGQVLGSIFSIALLRFGYGITSLLLGSFITYAAVQCITGVYIIRISQLSVRQFVCWNRACYSTLIRFGGGVLGGSLLNMMLNPFNRLALARFGGLSTIPLYDIAFGGSMRLRGILESGARALTPEISRIGANRHPSSMPNVTKINRQAITMILLLGVPVFSLLIAFAKPLLHTWLGARFSPQLPMAVQIALLGAFASLLGTPAFYTLLGLGKTQHVLWGFAIQSGANVVIVAAVVALGRSVDANTVLAGTAAGMALATAYLVFQKTRSVRMLDHELESGPSLDPIRLSCSSD